MTARKKKYKPENKYGPKKHAPEMNAGILAGGKKKYGPEMNAGILAAQKKQEELMASLMEKLKARKAAEKAAAVKKIQAGKVKVAQEKKAAHDRWLMDAKAKRTRKKLDLGIHRQGVKDRKKIQDKKTIATAKRKKVDRPKKARLARLKEDIAAQEGALQAYIEVHDPFWNYKPNTSSVSIAGKALLEEYLRPDDMPEGLLDSQLDVHLCDSDIIGAFGGNQGGKTTLEVIEALIFATGHLPISLRNIYPRSKMPDIRGRPRRLREVTVDSKLLRANLLPAFRQWIPRDCLKGGSWEKSYKVEDDILTVYKDGRPFATIQFKTNQQDVGSFQGVPLDRLGYDEEPAYAIHKENLLRFTTAARLNILFSMTPTNGMSWVHGKLLLRQNGKSISCFQIPSITNQRANIDILREILDGLPSYEERKMRLLGAFVSLTGLIYGALFKPPAHIVPPFPLNKDDFIVYRGLDPHTSKPSVWVEVAIDREGNEFVCGAEELAGDTQEIKTRMKERAEEYNYRLGWTNCDCSANTVNRLLQNKNIYSELKIGKDAIPGLMLSEKYAGSILAGVDDIKKQLRLNEITKKPGLVIMDKPELQPLIESMQTIERERFNNEEKMGMKDKVREGPHDYHAALRYAHQKRMHWIPAQLPVPKYQPVNQMVNY